MYSFQLIEEFMQISKLNNLYIIKWNIKVYCYSLCLTKFVIRTISKENFN